MYVAKVQSEVTQPDLELRCPIHELVDISEILFLAIFMQNG